MRRTKIKVTKYTRINISTLQNAAKINDKGEGCEDSPNRCCDNSMNY